MYPHIKDFYDIATHFAAKNPSISPINRYSV